ncbi:DMT family transporter [Roseiconus nitratireducens]|uniref:DMT family transporter n=1 Tax=Roseiconus nitratireducens TaxID=2605748 RepID=A0A5M6CXV5_9BACT|nr:DMT family transporter [Roseiconus nitratireducens]KAA5540047.1 DMT family transporter [Roseiconus nitratireducens]
MSQATTLLLVAVGVGLLAGGLLGAQPSVNGTLGRNVAHPLQASLISFASGTALLLVLTVTVGGGFPPRFLQPPASLPWWVWGGGAIGVVMVSTSLFWVPKVGSLPWFAAVMTGQTVAALFLDHYGLLGNPRAPVSPLRLLGTLLLIVGVVVIVGAKQWEHSHARLSDPSAIESSSAKVNGAEVNRSEVDGRGD